MISRAELEELNDIYVMYEESAKELGKDVSPFLKESDFADWKQKRRMCGDYLIDNWPAIYAAAKKGLLGEPRSVSGKKPGESDEQEGKE